VTEKRGGCHVTHASDGTPIRVQGSIDQPALDALAAAVKAYQASRCKHEGPHQMPEIAQKIHGRRGYVCELDAGHEGLHRWAALTWAGESG